MNHLYVRPVARADKAALIEANNLSRDYHVPWVRPCTEAEGFERWFERTITGADVSLIARYSLNNDIIGVITISQIVLGVFRSAYLGFYGMADYAGQGLMTAAVDQACGYAFSDLGLHRLEANIQPENRKSIALVGRCGFQKEGFSPRYLYIDGAWADHERWARLDDRS